MRLAYMALGMGLLFLAMVIAVGIALVAKG
jgi:hypothetical protein